MAKIVQRPSTFHQIPSKVKTTYQPYNYQHQEIHADTILWNELQILFGSHLKSSLCSKIQCTSRIHLSRFLSPPESVTVTQIWPYVDIFEDACCFVDVPLHLQMFLPCFLQSILRSCIFWQESDRSSVPSPVHLLGERMMTLPYYPKWGWCLPGSPLWGN